MNMVETSSLLADTSDQAVAASSTSSRRKKRAI